MVIKIHMAAINGYVSIKPSALATLVFNGYQQDVLNRLWQVWSVITAQTSATFR